MHQSGAKSSYCPPATGQKAGKRSRPAVLHRPKSPFMVVKKGVKISKGGWTSKPAQTQIFGISSKGKGPTTSESKEDTVVKMKHVASLTRQEKHLKMYQAFNKVFNEVTIKNLASVTPTNSIVHQRSPSTLVSIKMKS